MLISYAFLLMRSSSYNTLRCRGTAMLTILVLRRYSHGYSHGYSLSVNLDRIFKPTNYRYQVPINIIGIRVPDRFRHLYCGVPQILP